MTDPDKPGEAKDREQTLQNDKMDAQARDQAETDKDALEKAQSGQQQAAADKPASAADEQVKQQEQAQARANQQH